MSKLLKKILIVLSFILFLGGFYVFAWGQTTGQNYKVHTQIRRSLVDHPEFIPSATTVRFTSAGYDALIADFYWLGAVQYIGANAVSAEYKKYLAVMLELITDLSPHFTYPYEIGLLMLPDVNERYENRTTNDTKKWIDEAIALGQKGIKANCDASKLERIRDRYDLDALFKDPSLANPCSSAMLPYYLAYASYWSKKDPREASFYYRVSGLQSEAPSGAKLMSAIMQGKSWDREKAIIMFLSLAESLDTDKSAICKQVTSKLRELLIPGFGAKQSLTPEFLKQVEQVRAAMKIELWEKQEEIEKGNISNFCSSYLDKSVRELNLKFIQDADALYFKKTGKHARTAQELVDLGVIKYLPRDYQKQDAEYEIIYVYDPVAQAWDFEMGNYIEYLRENP